MSQNLSSAAVVTGPLRVLEHLLRKVWMCSLSVMMVSSQAHTAVARISGVLTFHIN